MSDINIKKYVLQRRRMLDEILLSYTNTSRNPTLLYLGAILVTLEGEPHLSLDFSRFRQDLVISKLKTLMQSSIFQAQPLDWADSDSCTLRLVLKFMIWHWLYGQMPQTC